MSVINNSEPQRNARYYCIFTSIKLNGKHVWNNGTNKTIWNRELCLEEVFKLGKNNHKLKVLETIESIKKST
jgi:hypothetical protein